MAVDPVARGDGRPAVTDPVLDVLLAAVIAEPDSDLPRLAYADRCLEVGDDDRAEFIRVQLELARLRPGPEEHRKAGVLLRRHRKGAPVRVKARTPATLLMREQLLLGRNPGWYVLPLGEAVTTGLYRGFVSEACLPCDDWLRDGPALVRAAPLTRVRLGDKFPYVTFTQLWGWSRLEQGRDAGSPTYLPRALYDRLPESDEVAPPVGLWRTEERAQAALSAAALSWARTAVPAEAAP